jgi:hypothetical protein
MLAGRRGTVLVPWPLSIHIDQIDAPGLIGPSTLHACQGRAGYIRDRHYLLASLLCLASLPLRHHQHI